MSFLAYHDNPFFKDSKGDCADCPGKVIEDDDKHSYAMPVASAITKCDASGESITMDIKSNLEPAQKTRTSGSIVHLFTTKISTIIFLAQNNVSC